MAKPLTIGLLSQGSRNWVGGAELTKNLVLATSAYCQSEGLGVQFCVIGSSAEFSSVTSGLAELSNVVWIETEPNKKRPFLVDRMLRYVQLSGMVKEYKIDFLYPCARPLPGSRCHAAAWIPDFQHKHMPEFFSPAELASRDKSFGRIATRSHVVVLSSNSAKEDFAQCFPANSAKARVLPFRVNIPEEWIASDPGDTRRKYHLPHQYFIVCNQFWRHKNHRVVLEAIATLAKDHPDLVVAMTGNLHDYRNPQYASEILALVHRRGIHANCRFLGLIPKQDQINLVRASSAVVQPSFFEGWSTIVEEAHFLGKPILLSDLPVHREQCPPGAAFFNPNDAQHLATLIRTEISQSATTIRSESYAEKVLQFGKDFFDIACSRQP